MNDKEMISTYLNNKQFNQLIQKYSTKDIVNSITYTDALYLAYGLLYNANWDEDQQEFSVDLLNQIRDKYPEEWNKYWENDGFLGLACDITCKYDERYSAFKRAFDKVGIPSASLLISLARCCICPGSPPISYNDAIGLLLKALAIAPYSDAIGLLSHIYSLKDDVQNENYWKSVLENSDTEFISPPIEPKFPA